jgi:MFS family permease
MQKSVSGNITRLYLIKIAKWFMLFMPIVVPFYEANGLGMKEVMFLQGIYSITIVLLEVPSGYLADVLGRKKTLIFGAILGFSGFLTYSLSFGFWGFLVAEVILGIGQSLISGADSAMLYDSLLDMKKEKNYIRHEGRITSSGNLAEAVAGTLGGLLAGLSIRYPYIAQTAVAFIAVPAAFTLVEPKRHLEQLGMKFRDILNVVKYSLWDNKALQKNIFFSSLIGTATLTMAWFVQPIFLRNDIPIEGFGLLWTLLNLTVAAVAAIAWKLEQILKEKLSIFLIAILVPAGYLAISYSNLVGSLTILFIFYMVRGFATPVLKDYINRLARSDIRATILSVRNFIIRLNFALIGPFLGWYTDTYTLAQALLLAGIIFLVLSMFTMVLFIRTFD